MNIVFTGKMDMTRDRETEKFEEFGITVQKGITKQTDVLIRGWDAGQGKLSKAEKYNIKIMREREFFNWLRKENPEYFL